MTWAPVRQVEEEYARLMVEREALEAEKAQLIKVPLLRGHPGRARGCWPAAAPRTLWACRSRGKR